MRIGAQVLVKLSDEDIACRTTLLACRPVFIQEKRYHQAWEHQLPNSRVKKNNETPSYHLTEQNRNIPV